MRDKLPLFPEYLGDLAKFLIFTILVVPLFVVWVFTGTPLAFVYWVITGENRGDIAYWYAGWLEWMGEWMR